MNIARRKAALEVRTTAAELAERRDHPVHVANGDELHFRHDGTSSKKHEGESSYLGSFTKGLAHDPSTGLLQEPDDFQRFVIGIENGHSRRFATRSSTSIDACDPNRWPAVSRGSVSCSRGRQSW